MVMSFKGILKKVDFLHDAAEIHPAHAGAFAAPSLERFQPDHFGVVAPSLSKLENMAVDIIQ